MKGKPEKFVESVTWSDKMKPGLHLRYVLLTDTIFAEKDGHSVSFARKDIELLLKHADDILRGAIK